MKRNHAYYLYCLGGLQVIWTNTVFTVNLHAAYHIDVFWNIIVSKRNVSGLG